MIAGVTAVLAVALFALPVGIISNGFIAETEAEEVPVTCPNCQHKWMHALKDNTGVTVWPYWIMCCSRVKNKFQTDSTEDIKTHANCYRACIGFCQHCLFVYSSHVMICERSKDFIVLQHEGTNNVHVNFMLVSVIPCSCK